MVFAGKILRYENHENDKLTVTMSTKSSSSSSSSSSKKKKSDDSEKKNSDDSKKKMSDDSKKKKSDEYVGIAAVADVSLKYKVDRFWTMKSYSKTISFDMSRQQTIVSEYFLHQLIYKYHQCGEYMETIKDSIYKKTPLRDVSDDCRNKIENGTIDIHMRVSMVKTVFLKGPLVNKPKNDNDKWSWNILYSKSISDDSIIVGSRILRAVPFKQSPVESPVESPVQSWLIFEYNKYHRFNVLLFKRKLIK
eukprot:GHVR01054496.1.p1 GENE.GHVR01054496.1~~GHVR01054496.1.p1  ORF type:complete len:249 (+),score=36.02 GHVR01054496.1:145-891(+)